MNEQEKLDLERQLNTIMFELEEVVRKLGYGVSMMVLPAPYNYRGLNSSACIHECTDGGGLISVDGLNDDESDGFIGVLSREFEHFDIEKEEN